VTSFGVSEISVRSESLLRRSKQSEIALASFLGAQLNNQSSVSQGK
jgi:hypothetical protein